MHILGKIFLTLIVAGSVAAFFFSTRVYEIRNAWMKEAERLEKEIETNRLALENSDQERERLTVRFESAARPWKAYWTGIKVAPQPGAEATGGLLIQLGMPQLKQPPDPANPLILHAFQATPGSDEPVYVGEFKVEQLGEGQSVLMPNWLLRPNEIQFWTFGDNWHFREAIPPGEKALIGALDVQLTEGLERLLSRQAELAQTEEIIKRTQAVLDRRVGELEGIPNPDEKRDKLPPEFVAGLQQTILDEESQVNRVTAEVQQLRDELFDVQSKFDELKRAIDAELQRLDGKGSKAQASLTLGR